MNEFDQPEGIENTASEPVNEPELMPETAESSITPLATLRQRLLMVGTAVLVVFLDQFTKYLVETKVPLNTVWEPIPGWGDWLRITHTGNTGAVFGTFQGGSPIFAGIAILVTLALLYYNFTLPAGYKVVRIILGVQLGGALGNLIDRFRLGHVTDFIDIGPWYIFNIADAAIVFGSIALALVMWLEQPPPDKPEPSAPLTETAEKSL